MIAVTAKNSQLTDEFFTAVEHSCFGPKYADVEDKPHANAYLYNATLEIASGMDRNALSPQLKKLYPTLK